MSSHMKLSITDLGYRTSGRYPYSHRVEVLECKKDTISKIRDWLFSSGIPHTYMGSVFYLTRKDLATFLLRWS
jgi:hypothetical protein